MAVSLSLPADLHAELLAHLCGGDVEEVAFLFTDNPVSDAPLRVVELYRVPPRGFDRQSAYHVTLADDVRGDVIRRAWQLGGCLLEAHSHGGRHPAAFSRSDLAGLGEWVPHVRWRLRGLAYVALVFGDDSFDALVWEEAGIQPGPLDHIIVDGSETLWPTGITYRNLSEAQRDR